MTEKIKITFAPGCFDSFDGTQEELDAMIAEVTSIFENKDLSNDNLVYLGENDLSEEDWAALDEQDAKYMNKERTLQ